MTEQKKSGSLLPDENNSCWFRLCNGQTNCYVSMLCCIPVLIYNSILLYLFPCIYVILSRFCVKYVCCCCKKCCYDYYMYTDDGFQPIPLSLAKVGNPTYFGSSELQDNEGQSLSVDEVRKKVKWIRASQLSIKQNLTHNRDQTTIDDRILTTSNNKMYLFQNGIEADDVAQGALGDCWLLAAIASLAEFPGAIERCFKNNEKSDRGKYTIRLYDFRLNVRKRVNVVIDDYIPCSKDTHEVCGCILYILDIF